MEKTLIIDAHCHVYPEKVAQKAVENIGTFYNLKMSGLGDAENLIQNCDAQGILGCVICSVATSAHQVSGINNFIVKTVSGYPGRFTGLAAMHPDMTESEIESTIEFALSNNLKGIKLHPDFQKFNIDCPAAEKIYERCEGVLPILFHTGDDRFEFSRPHRLAKILKKYKNLKAIAAHFGGYSRWEETGCYEGLGNLYFDTSSSLFKLSSESALRMIEKFGVSKFMFGTDYPMWNTEKELERFYSLGLSESDRRAVLYENAVKVYGINLPHKDNK